MGILLSLPTFLLYLISAGWHYQYVRGKRVSTQIVLPIVALSVHAYSLYAWIDTPQGQNLSVSHVLSLIAWFINVMIVFIQPLRNLLLLSFPLSALSIVLVYYFPGEHLIQTREYPTALAHILLFIFSMGLLGIAGVQACLLYWQNHRLKHSSLNLVTQWLPPLETLEKSLFRTITFGFISLSFSLLLTFILLPESFFSTHVPKTILTLLAWASFGSLLVARSHSGLRGQQAAQWTLVSMILLLSAYLIQRIYT